MRTCLLVKHGDKEECSYRLIMIYANNQAVKAAESPVRKQSDSFYISSF